MGEVQTAKFKSKQILVIEDSPDFCALLKQLLEAEGYHVACAGNGLEALQWLKNSRELPSLILLDMMMPVMDGHEFRQRQEEDPIFAQIPVVAMTAHQDSQVSKIKLGAKDCIRKPPELTEIIRVVKRNCP